MILVDDKVWTFLYNKEIIFHQSSELEFAPCTTQKVRGQINVLETERGHGGASQLTN